MGEGTRCRRCLLSDMLSAEEYARTVERVRAALPARERTPDDAYAARLDACRACDQLQDGACMRCGCMVEMRAMRRDQHCPPPRRSW